MNPRSDRNKHLVAVNFQKTNKQTNKKGMSLSTYYLAYGRHVAWLRRRRRRRAYAPRSNTASHDKNRINNPWVSFSFPYEYGAPLGYPTGRRSSATTLRSIRSSNFSCFRVISIKHNFDEQFIQTNIHCTRKPLVKTLISELAKN